MSKQKNKDEERNWTSTTGLPKWKQSPIDLNGMHTLHQKFPPLLLQGHLSNNGCAKMTNTGQTVKIDLGGTPIPSIVGGPFTSEYQFSEMQFRWGPSDARGAEHSIEGIWFTMEAQMIHWNLRYGSIEKCYDKVDGLVILSFLIQVIGCPSMADNPNFTCVSDHLAEIRIPGKCTEIPRDCFRWVVDVCKDLGYYTYAGSLTTHPFQECVTWIVIPRAVKISAKQANLFRQIYRYNGERILRNFRSLQRIHERKIFIATEY